MRSAALFPLLALLGASSGCRLIADYAAGQADARSSDARRDGAVDLDRSDRGSDAARDGLPPDAPLPQDGPSIEAGPLAEPWGAWAAKLPLGVSCNPTWLVLTVDTTADELDGGDKITTVGEAGTKLSLREAIHIAANLGQPRAIAFDGTVFPLTGGDEIELDLAKTFPASAKVCIDGRNRGVTVRWPPVTNAPDSRLVPHLGPDSLLIGVTLLGLPDKINLASRAQVAGCRIDATYKALSAGPQTIIGPGNAFSGGTASLELGSIYAGVVVRDNDFGVDPRTGQTLPIGMAAEVWSSDAVFEGNVFARGSYGYAFNGIPTAPGPTIRKNFFGVDRTGQALVGGGAYINAPAGGWVIGPGNTFRNTTGPAISVHAGTAQVLITQNSISGAGGVAIDVSGLGLSPPTIGFAKPGSVTGTCSSPGVVELFSDPGDQAETYLGSVNCAALSNWTFTASNAPLPQGRNVTATLSAAGRTSALSKPVMVQ